MSVFSSASLPTLGDIPQARLATSLPGADYALVVPMFATSDGLELLLWPSLSDEASHTLLTALETVNATGKRNEIRILPPVSGITSSAIIAVGLGDGDDVSEDVLRQAAGVAARAAATFRRVASTLSLVNLTAAVEGTLLGSYTYRGKRGTKTVDEQQGVDTPANDPAASRLAEVVFLVPAAGKKRPSKAATREFETALTTAQAVCFARDLVNTPPLELYPASYANTVAKLGKQAGLTVEVYDEQRLAQEGFGGILAVGQGSSRAPRLVHLRHEPKKPVSSVALVGKGITFDTGGISLKRGPGMENMTSDMAGSAAVVATVIAAAELNLPVVVDAWLPLAENMPSATAQRPGDVIRHYGGLTSEILNTDAEGRIVLGDAIARACEEQPEFLIETATLTGAQLVALGTRTAGVMGSPTLRDNVAKIGTEVGELAWAMPLPEEIVAGVTGSDVADLRNTGTSSYGGMMAAGAYLQAFVADGISWAHLDVAGPAYNTTGVYGYNPKRATGQPVRTLLATLAAIANNPDALRDASANGDRAAAKKQKKSTKAKRKAQASSKAKAQRATAEIHTKSKKTSKTKTAKAPQKSKKASNNSNKSKQGKGKRS
ncbi:leucyl aminopeptidase [Corynebacterium choanae]|uniref:Probable cytosol aminopeptidase n=1 Tax=Corynebacterium choanae TaxID=1862358 RepID=A0A3G6J7F2_9CORY|nr:leucyl aminopeptidase [Corynebacterium choanae]AZA13987.1 Cytosol aminopeptidase [Corynebacterium choanae]